MGVSKLSLLASYAPVVRKGRVDWDCFGIHFIYLFPVVSNTYQYRVLYFTVYFMVAYQMLRPRESACFSSCERSRQ